MTMAPKDRKEDLSDSSISYASSALLTAYVCSHLETIHAAIKPSAP